MSLSKESWIAILSYLISALTIILQFFPDMSTDLNRLIGVVIALLGLAMGTFLGVKPAVANQRAAAAAAAKAKSDPEDLNTGL